jgi:hypothetical protein
LGDFEKEKSPGKRAAEIYFDTTALNFTLYRMKQVNIQTLPPKTEKKEEGIQKTANIF